MDNTMLQRGINLNVLMESAEWTPDDWKRWQGLFLTLNDYVIGKLLDWYKDRVSYENYNRLFYSMAESRRINKDRGILFVCNLYELMKGLHLELNLPLDQADIDRFIKYAHPSFLRFEQAITALEKQEHWVKTHISNDDMERSYRNSEAKWSKEHEI